MLNMSSSNKKSSCEDGEREFKLGLRYENGEGVQQDLFVAVKHYQQAVRHGNVGAIVKLGKAYQSGCGISKDQGKAIELFKKAITNGNSDGMVELGICYEKRDRCKSQS